LNFFLKDGVILGVTNRIAQAHQTALTEGYVILPVAKLQNVQIAKRDGWVPLVMTHVFMVILITDGVFAIFVMLEAVAKWSVRAMVNAYLGSVSVITIQAMPTLGRIVNCLVALDVTETVKDMVFAT
jgi:hypothetical protein